MTNKGILRFLFKKNFSVFWLLQWVLIEGRLVVRAWELHLLISDKNSTKTRGDACDLHSSSDFCVFLHIKTYNVHKESCPWTSRCKQSLFVIQNCRELGLAMKPCRTGLFWLFALQLVFNFLFIPDGLVITKTSVNVQIAAAASPLVHLFAKLKRRSEWPLLPTAYKKGSDRGPAKANGEGHNGKKK